MSDQRKPKTDQGWTDWIASEVFDFRFLTLEELKESGEVELVDSMEGHWFIRLNDNGPHRFLTSQQLVDLIYSIEGYVSEMYALIIKLHGLGFVDYEKFALRYSKFIRQHGYNRQALHNHVWDIWHDPHWNKELV